MTEWYKEDNAGYERCRNPENKSNWKSVNEKLTKSNKNLSWKSS
jgi:hypothetical protein